MRDFNNPPPMSQMANRFWTFSAGEVGVELKQLPEDSDAPVMLELRNGHSDGIMQLLMEADAYQRAGYTNLHLYMPYVPYGRQDRVTAPNTSFSLQVFAKLIAGIGFSKIIVVDPHSDITEKLLPNLQVITQGDILTKLIADTPLRLAFFRGRAADTVLIAPDKGASRRAAAASAILGVPVIGQASKIRTAETGEITGMEMEYFDPAVTVKDKHVIVVDDICDGGKTFIELSKLMDEAASRTLFVTHGIFSQGYGAVAVERGYPNTTHLYDEVFTTDTLDRSIVKKHGHVPQERILTINPLDYPSA